MIETVQDGARRLLSTKIALGYVPKALHAYVNADGVPIYYRARLEYPDSGSRAPEGSKLIRPLHLNGSQYKLGEPDFPPGKKPLYNLDRIAANPNARIWIVEGEKAADALTTLGVIATTSGGADSANTVDWSPLTGRTCILWPDNDDAGKAYIGAVGNILVGLGCALSCIDVTQLKLPAKGDAWDWVQINNQNATSNDLEALPRLAPRPETPNAAAGDLAPPAWPAAIDAAALHGIAGEFVRMIEPDTEADPVAILVQVLVAFGAFVGRGPHYRVEADEHHANLYTVFVGESAKARKGTSWGRVHEVFKLIPGWKLPVSGLSTGEGLKYHVRDTREETKTTKVGERVTEVVDNGVADKRLLVFQAEFASTLRVAGRDGNTLSAAVREGWDTGNLQTLTKNDPVTATGAHICIVGHITIDELRAELSATDCANGFANRFLFVAVRRSKLLPFGGDTADRAEIEAIANRLSECAELARTRGRIRMSPDAKTAWEKVYPALSAGGDGLHGAVTARAEAQTIRLALIYCLLDGAAQIDVPHLLAALAVWQYCDTTAKHVFGASIGDKIADEIMRRLRQAGDSGLTRTEISDVFKRHQSAERIGAALELLRTKGRTTCETLSTGGRPTELWRAT